MYFYSSIQGSRGEATRCGTPISGIRATAQSWSGSISVYLYEENGEDHYSIKVRSGSGIGGREIATGLIRDLVKEGLPYLDFAKHVGTLMQRELDSP